MLAPDGRLRMLTLFYRTAVPNMMVSNCAQESGLRCLQYDSLDSNQPKLLFITACYTHNSCAEELINLILQFVCIKISDRLEIQQDPIRNGWGISNTYFKFGQDFKQMLHYFPQILDQLLFLSVSIRNQNWRQARQS